MSETKEIAMDEILDALKPFAELGLAFGEKFDPEGSSPWDRIPDDFAVQIGATPQLGWSATAGQLRNAARVYYSARDE